MTRSSRRCDDLRGRGVDVVTIGQYLQPSRQARGDRSLGAPPPVPPAAMRAGRSRAGLRIRLRRPARECSHPPRRRAAPRRRNGTWRAVVLKPESCSPPPERWVERRERHGARRRRSAITPHHLAVGKHLAFDLLQLFLGKRFLCFGLSWSSFHGRGFPRVGRAEGSYPKRFVKSTPRRISRGNAVQILETMRTFVITLALLALLALTPSASPWLSGPRARRERKQREQRKSDHECTHRLEYCTAFPRRHSPRSALYETLTRIPSRSRTANPGETPPVEGRTTRPLLTGTAYRGRVGAGRRRDASRPRGDVGDYDRRRRPPCRSRRSTHRSGGGEQL